MTGFQDRGNRVPFVESTSRSPTPTTTTETDGQPGFGIALVALLAAGLLAARRRD